MEDDALTTAVAEEVAQAMLAEEAEDENVDEAKDAAGNAESKAKARFEAEVQAQAKESAEPDAGAGADALKQDVSVSGIEPDSKPNNREESDELPPPPQVPQGQGQGVESQLGPKSQLPPSDVRRWATPGTVPFEKAPAWCREPVIHTQVSLDSCWKQNTDDTASVPAPTLLEHDISTAPTLRMHVPESPAPSPSPSPAPRDVSMPPAPTQRDEETTSCGDGPVQVAAAPVSSPGMPLPMPAKPGVVVTQEVEAAELQCKARSRSRSSMASQSSVASDAVAVGRQRQSFLEVRSWRSHREVASLAEAFLLEDDCFEYLLATKGEDYMVDIWENMKDDSLSTAFTGVEACGTACNLLRKAWSFQIGLELGVVPVTHQIEWNSGCIKELLPCAKAHNTCVFENILQFFRPELKPLLDECLRKPSMAIEILGPVIAKGTAMRREGWCLTHQKWCILKPSKRHVAGTSCKPYSKKGSQLGQVDPEIVFTLAWIGLRIELQEPEVISENVKTVGQPGMVASLRGGASVSNGPTGQVCDAGLGNLLLRFLAPYYDMECVVMDPTFFGFPFSREREFIKMTHKQKVVAKGESLTQFQTLGPYGRHTL